MKTRRVHLSSPDADVEIDLDHGCRIASLRTGGHELLITSADSPIDWGLYPMAPFAGRVRGGVFEFRSRRHELPRHFDAHALHGTVFSQEWEQDGASTFVTDLGSPWPFPGFVRQDVVLDEGCLRLHLEVHATAGAMPASCGWHPWFRRRIGEALLRLDFRPGYMLRRDAEGIATRERTRVPLEPWDDCFGDVSAPPILEWPDFLGLEIASDCRWWVVYNKRDHALCVEPQTAPPNSLNCDPQVVEPGRPLTADLTLSWTQSK